MDIPDAIPSRGDVVVVPDYLREILRQTAERKLREACDLAFPPDMHDEVVEAVHLIDAFTKDRLTPQVVLTLIPSAIAWNESEATPPHTTGAVAQNKRLLLTIRELVEFRDRLGGGPPEPGDDTDVLEVTR
jgi:hypothetical protein